LNGSETLTSHFVLFLTLLLSMNLIERRLLTTVADVAPQGSIELVIAQTVWEFPEMSAVVDMGRILTGCTQAPAQDRERAPDDARTQS
jgi:hypothetical protein